MNSQQNSRIKETVLKGSQSRCPGCKRGQAISCGPGRDDRGPLCGTGQAGQRPTVSCPGDLAFAWLSEAPIPAFPLMAAWPWGLCPLLSPACSQGGVQQAEHLAKADASPEMAQLEAPKQALPQVLAEPRQEAASGCDIRT